MKLGSKPHGLPIDRHHYRFLLDFARYMPGRDGGEILSLPDPLPSPELRLFDDELAECRNWLTSMGWKGQPLIAFQTQARRKNKGRWPIEHWVTTVLAAIDTVPDSWGVLIGSQDEAKEVREIANRCDDPRVHCVAGEFRNLRRLFALLSLAHSCVSLDTGPAHAAVTLGCPSVVLFSTGHPRVYHPVGPDDLVQVVTAIPEHQWPGSVPEFAAVNLLSDIKPEAVLDAWQRLQHRQL